MSDTELDTTAREAEATIGKVDALLKQAEEQLARHDQMLRDNNVAPGSVSGFFGNQSAEAQEEFARERQAIQEEIERDLPKQEAPRGPRVKPGRQMV